MKNAKCRLWKRFVATKIRYDRVKYIQIKNGLRALTTKLRLAYEQKVAINVIDKPKAFWKYANYRLKPRPAIPTLIKADGSTATTPKDKANKSWCKAVITATYKNGQRIQPGNYRLVSLTSVISKIMESLIRDEIVEHMVKHKLLSYVQHGFVPGRDCMTQMLLCLEEWAGMMKIGMTFDVIYTDFAKAFDSVAHERLLKKLNSIGIKADLLKWIKSFLCGRTQCVNVEGTTSEWKEVISEIPQGSVLGPIIFAVFINDMPEEVKYSTCKLFANDCKLYGMVNSIDQNKLQQDLINLERWSELWQLPFNSSKCKVMHFGHQNLRNQYYLNDQTLDKTDREKDLGVIIDDKLKFHVHAAVAKKKGKPNLRPD